MPLLCLVFLILLIGYPALVRSEPADQPTRGIKSFEVGATGWFTQGQTVWSHNASGLNSLFGDPTSKLKYKDVGTNVLEIHGKLRFNNRFFLRGHFGFADIGGGRLTDDDFLSAEGAVATNAGVSGEHRFSRTFSDLGGNSWTDLWYANADLGLLAHEFEDNKGFVDLFVGFQYWREKQTARGLRQVECTTTILCEPADTPQFAEFDGRPLITNRVQWTSLRLGGEIEYVITTRLTIDAKLALLLSWLHNEDIHHLRTDLAQNPSFRMTGMGLGTNADVNLKVMLVERLYLSGGYRVWFTNVLWDKDWQIFGANSTSATAPLNEFYSLRYGPTVSLTYTF